MSVDFFAQVAQIVAAIGVMFREADRLIITSAHKPLSGEPIADAS